LPNGKWDHEIVVASGREWSFEVGPNGKFLKESTEPKESVTPLLFMLGALRERLRLITHL
jgi:hypothetical protein